MSVASMMNYPKQCIAAVILVFIFAGAAAAFNEDERKQLVSDISSLVQEQQDVASVQAELDAELAEGAKAAAVRQKLEKELNTEKSKLDERSLAWQKAASDYQDGVRKYSERCRKATFRLPEQQQEYDRCKNMQAQLDQQKAKLENDKRWLDSSADEYRQHAGVLKDPQQPSGGKTERLEKRQSEINDMRRQWIDRYNTLVSSAKFKQFSSIERKARGCTKIPDDELTTPAKIHKAFDRASTALHKVSNILKK